MAACGSKTTDRPGTGGGGGVGATAGTSASTTAGTHAGTSGASGTTAGGTAGDNAVGGTGTTAGIGGAGSGTVTGEFDAGIEEGRNDVLPGAICDRMSTIQCAGEVACCATPRTYDECKSAMMAGCMDTLYIDAIAMNAITGFDAAAAKTAFTQYEAMAAACDPSVASWGSSVTGLRGILKGTVAPGKSCTVKSNKPEVAGASLASCSNIETTACMFHGVLSSVQVPTNWTCDAKGGDGTPCFTDVNCLDGLYCDNPDAKFEAKCQPRKQPGAACVNPNECDSLFCKKKVCVAVDQQAAYCLRND